MKLTHIISLTVLVALMATVFAIAQPASANSNFNITIYHGINGRSLGLAKELPVDVYVNGGLAVPGLKFKDTIKTSLPAGTYTFDVKLAGTNTTVMSFGPAEIPAGADVYVHAKLGAKKTPTLKVTVR